MQTEAKGSGKRSRNCGAAGNMAGSFDHFVSRQRKNLPGQMVSVKTPEQFAPPRRRAEGRVERRQHNLLHRLKHLQCHQQALLTAQGGEFGSDRHVRESIRFEAIA